MKKMIALVLALVMTLSLLPMSVWATDGEENLDPASVQQENVANEPEPQPLYFWWDGNLTKDATYIIDQGTNHTIWVVTDANLTNLPQLSTPTDISGDGSLGKLTLISDDSGSRIVWNSANAVAGNNVITMTVGGISYQMNVLVFYKRMVLEGEGGPSNTAIKLDQDSYEWVLYAEQYNDNTGKNDYNRVTADNFTIPANSRLSWKDDANDNDSVGDTLVLNAAGLTSTDFPLDLYVTGTDDRNYHFTVNYDDGSFMYRGVKIYTHKDDNGNLGYNKSPAEDGLSLFSFFGHVNYLFEKNVENTLYLRPQSDVASMEICGGKYPERESWGFGNIIDLIPPATGTDYYALTLYEGMTESGDVCIKQYDAEGREINQFQIIFEVPVIDQDEVFLWNYDGGWRLDGVKLDQGMSRPFIMSVGTQKDKLLLNKQNCVVTVEGNIGSIEMEDDGRIRLDTSSATDEHGMIKVTMKDSGKIYYLAIQIIFPELWVKSGHDYRPFVDIPFKDGIVNEVLSLECYFPVGMQGTPIKINPWSEETQSGFRLTATPEAYANRIGWDNNGNVRFDARGLTINDFPISLIAIDQDNRHYQLTLSDDVTYCYETANSTITMRLSPAQAKILSLPQQLTEDGELIVTIKNKNLSEDEVVAWRQLVEGEMALGLGFEVNVKDTENCPRDVFMYSYIDADTQVSVSDVHSEMLKIADNDPDVFRNYFGDGSRQNGNSFAWASANTGDTAILPSDSRDIFAWIFRYDGGEPQKDGFVVKFAPEKEDLFYIEDAPYAPVDAGRLTFVPHKNLDTRLAITEYTKESQSFKYDKGNEGVLTYTYTGEEETYYEVIDDILTVAARDNLQIDRWGVFWYDLLKVTAPTGYMGKTVECSFYTDDVYGANEVPLRYHWRGAASDLKFILTWFKPDTGEELVQQIVVKMSPMPGAIKWMDEVASPMDPNRVIFDRLPANSGAETVYEDGVLWTKYTNGVMVDADAVLAANLRFDAPEGATKFAAVYIGDGSDDPTLNFTNGRMADEYRKRLDSHPGFDLIYYEDSDSYGTDVTTLGSLLTQTYGANDEIVYYYSANRGTRGYIVKWIFDNLSPLYEYVQLDTTSYVCQWDEVLMKDSEVTGPVEVPTAINDKLANSDIMLVTDVHAQSTAEKFFFELTMVDKNQGNVFTEPDGETSFTIILPYEFMGNDPNGNPWTYETASQMKEAKILHYSDDFDIKEGNLKGTFTKRGIEFTVSSFSPFMLTWDESEFESNTGGYPGYYPIVSPEEKPVEKPTETKPVEKPTTPPAQETETPAPEDTTPVVPDEPVTDEPVVDEAPAVDTEPANNAGLWIGVGIVALAAIVVVLAVMAVRKKRKD